ncbi:hypothetical protein RB43ORF175c [Escherichia phage RB43]|uniref:Uncharacterized protein n=1 Tax=Escherichia phage RB43 TaxID=2887182 RepID=Q56BM3_9CAUD|nr:hypothetical protein RB43ORF175c [Escherichia phage RB43]AAX78697.1 hypothetical protein RB43ORF175c [Escherichia phage RB43]
MKRIFSNYLNLEFKTDGGNVWWWSSNLGVWFPEFTVTAESLERSIKSGNAVVL